jgi:Meckel syndrome type 1 protein
VALVPEVAHTVSRARGAATGAQTWDLAQSRSPPQAPAATPPSRWLRTWIAGGRDQVAAVDKPGPDAANVSNRARFGRAAMAHQDSVLAQLKVV